MLDEYVEEMFEEEANKNVLSILQYNQWPSFPCSSAGFFLYPALVYLPIPFYKLQVPVSGEKSWLGENPKYVLFINNLSIRNRWTGDESNNANWM